jgi:hypothetical protein
MYKAKVRLGESVNNTSSNVSGGAHAGGNDDQSGRCASFTNISTKY